MLPRQIRGQSLVSAFLLAASLVGPVFGQGAAQIGRWDPPIAWPIVGIHAAVLPTGEVFNLTYEDLGTELMTSATVWNPATGRFRDVSPGFGNMFCSGQNFLPNGELFVAGGFAGVLPGNCNAQGLTPAYIFNPFSLSWRTAGNMSFPRFYPTVLALEDGRQLIIGGQGQNCQYIPTMEVFDPGKGLSRVNGPRQIMQDYPRLFLLSDGSVIQVAPELHTSIMDSSMRSWRNLTATRLQLDRWEGAAFYLPDKQDRLMICGGYLTRAGGDFANPTASCEILDPLVANPSWRTAASLKQARGDLNSVLLPDGTVLVVGGGDHHRYEGPDLRPELYDPARNTWTVMAPQRYGRMYHSTAVLLPDGRVLSSGQDDDGSGDGVVSGAWGEVFSPPYLFRGARPGISKAPTEIEYGEAFEIEVSQTAAIEKLVLMGLSSVTHSTNVGQRYVPLDFTRTGGTKVQVQMTANLNLAPPGYYMLFAVNNKGVPSQARVVRAKVACFDLAVEHSPVGAGEDPALSPTRSSDCGADGSYDPGTVVQLTGRPAEGFAVASWTGTDNDNRTDNTNKVTMDSHKTVSVEYFELGPACYKLTRNHKSKPGGEVPTAEPAMSEECGQADQFIEGAEIALTAHPKAGWGVGRWIGTDNDARVLSTNQLTMPRGNHTVTVDYDKIRTSFEDSFEKNTFCTWNARDCKACVPDGCHLGGAAAPPRSAKVASLLERSDQASVDGSYALELTYESGSKGQDFLLDASPARGGGEPVYRASFWIRPQAGLTVKGTKTMVLQARESSASERIVFELFFKSVKKQMGTYALSIRGRHDSGAPVQFPAASILADEWRNVRIEWQAASAEGAGDGRLAIYLGDEFIAERALNNPSMRVDEIRFGQIKGKKKPTRGSVYFDLFESTWVQ